MRAFIALLLLPLAGCVDEAGYELTAEGVPSEVAVNETFEFHLEVTGGPERTSDHIGGHYWAASTADPDAEFANQAGACTHIEAEVVGDHHIQCSFTEPGTFYLRGHVRYEDEGTHNLWTDEHAVTVLAA